MLYYNQGSKKDDYVLKFDGTNDAVTVPNVPLFQTNYTSTFTIRQKFKVVFSGASFLFITANQFNDTKGVYFYITSSELIVVLFTDGNRGISYQSSFTFISDVEYDVVLSFNVGTLTTYINELPYSVSTGSFGGHLTTDNTTSLSEYSILSRAVGSQIYANGTCEVIQLFNISLNFSQVTALYADINAAIPNKILDIRPLYPKYIKTLNPNTPFLAATGQNCTIVGRNNPMNLAVDFEKL